MNFLRGRDALPSGSQANGVLVQGVGSDERFKVLIVTFVERYFGLQET